ncbi:MAG: ferritin-like domain-containing protein [Gemmatimonadaceae bacterium]
MLAKPIEIVFDPTAVRSIRGRRQFLSRLAIAAGALSLAPLVRRGYGITELLQAQGTTGKTEPNLSDTDILNYALTLEYLEATFYLRADSSDALPTGATIAALDPDGGGAPGSVPGLAGMSFPSPSTNSVATFFRTVRDHEITHVLALQAALASSALVRSAFAFNFGSAYASAANFMNTSLALEDTGVTAYLGQAANLDSLATLGTAGSILGVEAQHAASVRLLLGMPITVSNAAFDTPQTTTQVVAVASGFITQKPTLPFPKP